MKKTLGWSSLLALGFAIALAIGAHGCGTSNNKRER